MIGIDLRRLIDRLTPEARRLVESAAGIAVSRGHYEVAVEHLLSAMAEASDGDMVQILRHYEIEPERVKATTQRVLEGFKSGNQGRPAFSRLMVECLTDAWLVASVEQSHRLIRSGAVLAAVAANPGRFVEPLLADLLSEIPSEELRRGFIAIVAGSPEDRSIASEAAKVSDAAPLAGQDPSDESALGRFTFDFTKRARDGGIDPVFCRDREIQLMIDILSRRRKNNPIVVGDPGVGKTAVVEGLALKIVEGDVPPFLQDVQLRSLDLGLLQAGASVKGEFENRLRGVIDEVKASPQPIVLFIDEAHTLIGAGGAAGGGDASNLLKPALARGELRTIAATTWSEYKKYFEKDPALARRFQLVKLDEPSVDQAVTIIRGLRSVYERDHGVYVRDDAIVAAATLSARYLTGRQLPDKAVDILDTASARVHLSQTATPPVISGLQQKIAELQREREALVRDLALEDAESSPRTEEIAAALQAAAEERDALIARWEGERRLAEEIAEIRARLGLGPSGAAAGETPEADENEGAEEEASPGAEEADPDAAPSAHRDSDFARLSTLHNELADSQAREPLVNVEVTPEAVGQVVSDWTGIPIGSMVRDEADRLLRLGDDLKQRIIGQNQAIDAIDEGLRAAKAGLGNPDAPMGVFLLVGPSGVGKTETCLAVADLLFGGERFMVTINMSEFQEKHTVSRLIGSPPGYVGYGEGGVLTEGVRQRPYCVVLLDEVEKADLEVMNLFYQVFDKGQLSDGEGRVIDFKNTVVFLTSNLATDRITELGLLEERPDAEELASAIRPDLSAHFKPALLARMQIVPYYPLIGAPMEQIVRLKLNKVGRRLSKNHKARFSYADALVEEIARRCTEVEAGARNIDHIINRNLLPLLGTEVLQRMGAGQDFTGVSVDLSAEKDFVIDFEAS
ncbi:MAG: type VI secretion system ATPase TssH [Pseudomonadota bacterium]